MTHIAVMQSVYPDSWTSGQLDSCALRMGSHQSSGCPSGCLLGLQSQEAQLIVCKGRLLCSAGQRQLGII